MAEQVPLTGAQRREYNQRRHAQQRQQQMAERGALGVAELWFDEARRIAKQRAANGDESALHDLARTLSNWADRHRA
ncbi:hypothetical protein ACIHEI_36585 [Kitasatospora sp. NPDC051984]|uniref:hypothetical protein n=1 Tax=Kitasatospora sp. NPDC051984 TaxID=3364059 RepID=UPI0037CA0058